jgi:hypothetical protein
VVLEWEVGELQCLWARERGAVEQLGSASLSIAQVLRILVVAALVSLKMGSTAATALHQHCDAGQLKLDVNIVNVPSCVHNS